MMLLTDFHYKLIAELEHKYGNLNKVPEDNVKLSIIRKRLRERPRIDKYENSFSAKLVNSLNIKTRRYNVKYLYAIYEERTKDRKLKDIAREFKINLSSLDGLYRFIGFKRYQYYYAEITDRDIFLESDSTEGLAEKLRKVDKRFKKITRNVVSSNVYSTSKYKGLIKFGKDVRYKKISEDNIKEIIFKHAKSKSKMEDEYLIEKLNNQNGEGVFTLEEVNRWYNR